MGDHARLALRLGELQHRIGGTAKFEAAGLLQRLGLDQNGAAGERVELRVAQQRGAHNMRGNAGCRLGDVIRSGQGHFSSFGRGISARAAGWPVVVTR